MTRSCLVRRSLLALAIVCLLPGIGRAQGIALNGVGPVNRAMQGASTAAPIDAAGALYWNPATISGLESNELLFGIELLLPTESVSSTIQPGALGGGFPPVTLSDTTDGEPGAMPIPVFGWVHREGDSPWTIGLGAYGVGGFKTNYPSSTTNPILLPQNNTPGGFGGLGRVSSELQVYQIVPTVSYAVTDQFSIGFSPVLNIAQLTVNPWAFAAPDDADGSGAPRYPDATGTRFHYGAGVQLGVYYISDSGHWHHGFSIKSKQWFEPFRFNATDENGAPRLLKENIDYPMILSLGTAYTGLENWLFAWDVRYFDYANTDGFKTAGYAADGSVTGLGWKSVVATSFGVQYKVSDCFYLRGGYSYQQNPISDANSFYNVASPLIIEHLVSVGASWYYTPNVVFHAAYIHGFESSVSGPIQHPAFGPLAGTDVTNTLSADALSVGVSIRY